VSDPSAVGAERDPEFIRSSQRLLELYASYFRPQVRGFENLPERGPFLVVGNHSGGANPPDLPILLTAWWRERGVDEPVFALFHSFFLGLPGAGSLVAKAGAIEASPENATAVLERGDILIVYPGGDVDAFRPFVHRNRIDFGGRTGFVKQALRSRVPIVPVVTRGAHSTTIVLFRGDRVARAIPFLRAWRVDVLPLSLGPPWGLSIGLPTLPLPAKVTVQLCPPIDLAARYGPQAAEDESVVQACYDEVTLLMQAVMDDLVADDGRAVEG
jgi:1-acyl-sn-glycerol-3-phosphate acyltransferase